MCKKKALFFSATASKFQEFCLNDEILNIYVAKNEFWVITKTLYLLYTPFDIIKES